MKMDQKNIPIDPQIFKSIAVEAASELNLYWDVENHYDEWYQGFLKRHPFAFCKLHPEENPLEKERQGYFTYWEHQRASQLPKRTNYSIDETMILNVNAQNEVVYRPIKKNDNGNSTVLAHPYKNVTNSKFFLVCTFYLNWLYNRRGHPDGQVVGYTNKPLSALVSNAHNIITKALTKAEVDDPGCSFQ
jgi:hypothetical protein